MHIVPIAQVDLSAEITAAFNCQIPGQRAAAHRQRPHLRGGIVPRGGNHRSRPAIEGRHPARGSRGPLRPLRSGIALVALLTLGTLRAGIAFFTLFSSGTGIPLVSLRALKDAVVHPLLVNIIPDIDPVRGLAPDAVRVPGLRRGNGGGQLLQRRVPRLK